MNYDDLNIVVIAGTTRKQRQSINAARFIAEVGSSLEGVSTVLVDPVTLNLPGDGNDPEGKDPVYSEITAKADAFFIIVPEYNHSFPGSLKRVLDSELQNYIHKPVALAGVSAGPWGGIRAVESLVPVVRELGLVVTHADVYFPKIQEVFDPEGNLLNEYYKGSVERAFGELVWMARALKDASNKDQK